MRRAPGVGDDGIAHRKIGRIWDSFRVSHANAAPTAAEVMRQAIEIDEVFAPHMRFIR